MKEKAFLDNLKVSAPFDRSGLGQFRLLETLPYGFHQDS